jgi:predicted DCC family thiol-disulfide oxidoreductase YuxK
MNHGIVLFDGVCNLCNGSVQFIIRHDTKDYFRFDSLQSHNQKGNRIPEDYDSIILIENGKHYYRSTAALRITRRLNGLWKLLYIFIIVPPFIRNAVYDFIARNRYRWFGKQDVCMMPSAELKGKFL